MVTSSTTRSFAEDVREIDEFLRCWSRRSIPDAVPLCEVTDLYSALDTVERRAAATKLLLARWVEDAGLWKRDGYRSAATQMAGIAGISLSAAKNQLEASKNVAKLPATEQALRDGELSAATTTTSKPTKAGPSWPAEGSGRWSHPTTLATRRTNPTHE